MQDILVIINTLLPLASIISTSTAGEIIEGQILENSAVLSLTTFKSTNVHVELIEDKNERDIADKLANLTTSRTKLIIAFNNPYSNDGEDFLNWQTIGESMTITKADKSIIYEINNQKAQEIYRHFSGDDVANNLPISGIEFPLIFNEDGINIARAPIAVGDGGELIMAGHIKGELA